jgi:hypothetical protein
MNKALIAIGIGCLVVGLLWPWLRNVPLGRLPGDFLIVRGDFRCYVPLSSSILISLAVTLLFWLFRK